MPDRVSYLPYGTVGLVFVWRAKEGKATLDSRIRLVSWHLSRQLGYDYLKLLSLPYAR